MFFYTGLDLFSRRRKYMKKITFVFLFAATGLLAACGENKTPTSSSKAGDTSDTPAASSEVAPVDSSEAPVEASKHIATYIGTFEGGYYIPAYSMVQSGYDNYVVDLYSDNTYVSNRVTYMDMYGTIGSVVITTTGSYATSENEDGDTIVSLSDAASILYTTCGMFNFQYSWGVDGIADSEFPVSLMGSSSASDTLDFFKSEYGFGYSFLTSDTGCTITEVYLPKDYAEHFHTKAQEATESSSAVEEKILYKLDGVVNPYKGEVKAHDFGKKVKNVYVGTFEGGYYIPAYSMLQAGYDNYVVTTFEDGTYNAINVKYMNMYGTIGSVTLETTGKYKNTENEDGDIVVEMAAADSIIYTTSGMFFYQFQWGVDGMEDSTFPVALMGSSSASDTLDFFKSEYGYAYSFLTTDSNSLIKELNLPDEIAAHYATKDASGEETGDSSSAE